MSGASGQRLAIDQLATQRGSAKALLLTVLGEFVLPAGGSAWTSSLVEAADALAIGEKNARQAIARIGDDGLLEPTRHGRKTRWSLTDDGIRLLESGARRIYEFGSTGADWDGQWLLAHCPVAEPRRAARNQLRTQLAFLGFGELSPSLLVSPHLAREPELRAVLDSLGLLGESVIFRSTTTSDDDRGDLVRRAWDLDELGAAYADFSRAHSSSDPGTGRARFRALVDLVHDWRRFPFVDPELPPQLLPGDWEGASAAALFRDRRAEWSPAAQAWFGSLEAGDRQAS